MANIDPRKAFDKKLAALGAQNPRVVAVSCDSASGGGLSGFFQAFPERSIECGISEQTAVSVCAAMARQGFIPFLVAINPFLTMRSYEQVRDDVGYANANVKIIGSGGGLAYSTLGASHIAIEDVALMRTVPNITILAPGDADEVEASLDQALAIDGPVYIRMPRQARPLPKPTAERRLVPGQAEYLTEGRDVAILCCGPSVGEAMEAARLLQAEGISASVVDFLCIKPLDQAAVLAAAKGHRLLFSVEEHILTGGLGSAVCEVLSDLQIHARLVRLAIPDGSKQTGPYEELVDYYGLSGKKVAAAIKARLESKEEI